MYIHVNMHHKHAKECRKTMYLHISPFWTLRIHMRRNVFLQRRKKARLRARAHDLVTKSALNEGVNGTLGHHQSVHPCTRHLHHINHMYINSRFSYNISHV